MKKINTLLLLLVVIISACKKDQHEVKETALFSRSNSKLKSSRPLHAGDPNLDASWDWTQHSWTAYFNNADGSVGSVTTLNPFIDGAQKVYGNVDVSKADMYPANGWMLVSRDFGTPTEANAYPFLLLYNKYRGVLRVCVLRTYDVLSSYQQITLSYATNSSYPDLVEYSPTIPPYNISYPYVNTKNSDYKQTAVTFAGVQEWMIADFDVKKYSQTIDNNTSFNISVSEVAQSDVVVNGNIQLDGTAQPQAGGPDVVGRINNLSNFVTSTNEGLSKVLAIPKANIDDIVSGGSGLLLKTILKIASGFSGGSAGVPYNIKLKGTINQTGFIKLNSPKTSFSVYLKPQANSIAYRAVQDITWGVFGIGNISSISDDEQMLYTWVTDEYGYPGEVYDGQTRSISLAPNYITNSNFVINPALANEVASIEMIDIMENAGKNGCPCTISNSEFLPLAQFQSAAKQITTWNSSVILLGIKITFTNGIIVYQTIPY
ncbi:hypothetical protein EV200_102674 [Pedobacter psychrotolerans]|uniref:Uncharacterized protein n=1 Tax=Pedobacter psychrotolerans TaxID=1843235 RepID=A0A4R2HIU9_9SPHI|nr:hypothetical protein [Pedobacter psychrotolerans]TCO29251.1 hypothetical protein EV200_102674 [Pedobacter psychrotolerans]GGE55335.1 hypothetical protein GCM10011413_22130 [Pedobacter psychrotolerans]